MVVVSLTTLISSERQIVSNLRLTSSSIFCQILFFMSKRSLERSIMACIEVSRTDLVTTGEFSIWLVVDSVELVMFWLDLDNVFVGGDRMRNLSFWGGRGVYLSEFDRISEYWLMQLYFVYNWFVKFCVILHENVAMMILFSCRYKNQYN